MDKILVNKNYLKISCDAVYYALQNGSNVLSTYSVWVKSVRLDGTAVQFLKS